MIPLNVTHTVIYKADIHTRLISGDVEAESATPLRHMLSTLILFFAKTYKSTYGFENGPPLHDPLTIAYLSHPEIFKVRRYRVDVELAGTHTTGETIVDLWNYQGLEDDDNWGVDGKNCLVAESVDVKSTLTIALTIAEI